MSPIPARNAAVIFAGISAAGTLIAAGAAVLAHRRSKDAQKHAKKSADAADRSATAAEKALHLEQRRAIEAKQANFALEYA